jgi:hypothetical protein
MSAAFSASGHDAITRTIHVDLDDDATAHLSASGQFEGYYEIGRTAEEIIRGNYQRVSAFGRSRSSVFAHRLR